MAAELSNYAKDILLRVSVLKGLGRDPEADVMRDTAIAGIADAEMRALVIRDLADPGSIIGELTSRQMASEPP